VVDLGKQVPVETIIQNAVDQNADAIGLSALLVSTSRQMGLAVNELQRRKINIPVLIGGAAINQDFAENIRLTEQGEIFNAGVYYCADAFEGLSVMEDIQTSPKELPPIQVKQPAPTQQAEVNAAPCPGRSVAPAPIPSAPFWGYRFIQSIPVSEILPYLSKTALYRLSWGAGNIKGEKWEQVKTDFNMRLQTMLTQNESENWLQPQALYGFFPAAADGNQVIVYDDQTIHQESPVEKLRFSFPRQSAGECLCLADYLTPAASQQFDVLPLQLVTVGHAATQRIQALQDAGDYSEAYFSHGLAVQLAEATAEFIHQKIRRELGISARQGKRYSWGYPPLPDLTEHGKLFHLLPAEEKMDMTLTAAFQLVPEQSTAAMVIHHPQAKYFTIQNGLSQQ
jgi:5-methyltetrahydrofolate--homocysteine methyltransferase